LEPQEVDVQQSDLKLDGNAIAGLLREIFAMEMTTAQSTCAGCGKVHLVGRVDVYLNAPGAVVRCPACGQVMMLIVHTGDRYWIDLTGTRRLQFRSDPS
jgi:ribosomal protein L32